MKRILKKIALLLLCNCAFFGSVLWAAEPADVQEQLRQMRQQNEQLQQQLLKQQELIDSLSHKVSTLEGRAAAPSAEGAEAPKPFSLGKVILSGEGGLAFLE